MQKINSVASAMGSTKNSFRSSVVVGNGVRHEVRNSVSPTVENSKHTPVQRTSENRPAENRTENKDELARIFNTVLVSSQSKGKRDFSGELSELAESAPFKAILSAVRQLSRIHGMTERQASEQIIQTFRKMDQIWGEYVFREGLEKLKSSK